MIVKSDEKLFLFTYVLITEKFWDWKLNTLMARLSNKNFNVKALGVLVEEVTVLSKKEQFVNSFLSVI